MEKIFHAANTRGYADHGWLKSYHTFSFASYHNPERMNFGVLRVINDDVIEAEMGFDTHPHNNMEIISVPLTGELRHKDTLGNAHVIREGEIQAMTAGAGIAHSEYSNLKNGTTNFLQIWILPKKREVQPGYSQLKFDAADRKNCFQLIVSPDGRKKSVQINQDAFFSLLDLDSGKILSYQKYLPTNDIYLFLLEGEMEVVGQILQRRDGLGLKNLTGDLSVQAKKNSRLLLMEVPPLSSA